MESENDYEVHNAYKNLPCPFPRPTLGHYMVSSCATVSDMQNPPVSRTMISVFGTPANSALMRSVKA